MSLVIRSLLFLLLLTVSSHVLSQQNIEAPCGMTYNDEGVLVVDNLNGVICEDDLAMQMIYILYADMLDSGIWKAAISPFLHEETINSEFIPFASNAIGISPIAVGLMDIVAAIGWFLLAPLIIYKGKKVYVMYAAKKDGDEDSEEINRPKLVAYFGFLAMLAMPVGGMMLGQGMSVVGAIPSLYASNQLLSAYLSGVEIAESDVAMDDNLITAQGQAFATGLVSMQLCQSRTAKALFQENAKPESAFFDTMLADSWMPDWVTGFEQDFTNLEVNACLSYHYEGNRFESASVNPVNSVSKIRLKKSAGYLGRCPGAGIRDYVEEVHGYEHLCGEIGYSYPGSTEDINNWGMTDSLNNILTEFSPSRYFSYFRNKETEIRMILFNFNRSEAEELADIQAIFDELAEEIIEPKLRTSTLFNETDRERLLLQYIYALNGLLGANVLDDADVELTNDAVQYLIPGLNDDNEGFRYGAEYLTEYANKIGDLLEEMHCADNWGEYSELRKKIVEYNRADGEDEVQEQLLQFNKTDCLRFVNYEATNVDSENRDERSRYVGYQTKHDLNIVFADIDRSSGVAINKLSAEDEAANRDVIVGLVANDRYRQAVTRKMILEGYYTSVKKAFIKVLSERLMDEVGQEDMYVVARQKGAAALGSLMMSITQSQAGGVYYKSLIQQTGTVSTYADKRLFINTDAFGADGQTKIDNVNRHFTPFDARTFFQMGYAGMVSPEEARTIDIEEDEYNTLMGNIESMLFEPLIHIKKASGIPSDVGLMEGLEDCMNGDSSRCISSASHPMTSMSRFGHHLADNMLTLYISHLIIQMINDRIGLVSFNSNDGGAATNKTVERLKFLVKGAGFLLTGAISIVAFVLNFFSPIFLVLFAVGMFFAYILPILGFLYSLSMVLLWLVALGLGSLTLPFYILVKMFTIETSHKDGFLDFYQTFLNPYVKLLFITIAVVFSFMFMSISLFAVNSAFSMLFSGMDALVESSGGLISGLMFKLLLYIAYFVSIFVLITMCIKMVKTLPDMMARQMKMNGTNDDNFIDNMQFESYVQANIVRQIAELPKGAGDAIAKNSEQRRMMKDIQANMGKIDAFLAQSAAGQQGKNADENAKVEGDKNASEDNIAKDEERSADESKLQSSGKTRRGSREAGIKSVEPSGSSEQDDAPSSNDNDEPNSNGSDQAGVSDNDGPKNKDE